MNKQYIKPTVKYKRVDNEELMELSLPVTPGETVDPVDADANSVWGVDNDETTHSVWDE